MITDSLVILENASKVIHVMACIYMHGNSPPKFDLKRVKPFLIEFINSK